MDEFFRIDCIAFGPMPARGGSIIHMASLKATLRHKLGRLSSTDPVMNSQFVTLFDKAFLLASLIASSNMSIPRTCPHLSDKLRPIDPVPQQMSIKEQIQSSSFIPSLNSILVFVIFSNIICTY